MTQWFPYSIKKHIEVSHYSRASSDDPWQKKRSIIVDTRAQAEAHYRPSTDRSCCTIVETRS
jgi:hypothetical protein